MTSRGDVQPSVESMASMSCELESWLYHILLFNLTTYLTAVKPICLIGKMEENSALTRIAEKIQLGGIIHVKPLT